MNMGNSLKVDFIADAYSQLRISGLTKDPTPDDLEVALIRMETMAAEWAKRNICSNYNFEDQPDPNSETWVDRAYAYAFSTNLAVRLIPDFNKQVPQTLISQASQSLSNMSAITALERLNQIAPPSTMPTGSGNTLWSERWYRFYRNINQAPNSCKTKIMVVGNVNDYFEDYETYLRDNEYIASFDIIVDPGLVLVSSETDGDRVDYRIEAAGSSLNGGFSQLTISIKTNLDRVSTRFVNFSLTPDPVNASEGL